MIKYFIRGIILFLLVKVVLAIVPASIDRSNIQVGQTFTLNIDVSNTNGTPEIDTLRNNFDILGTSNSSQISIINGQTNSQKSIMVTLSPKNSGKQQIPAIKVGSDVTNPITINVSKTPQSIMLNGDTKSQVFIDVSLDSSSTYVNVPVVYSLKLYFTVPLNNLSMANFDTPDAQIKPLGKNAQYRSKYHGKAYEVIEQKLLITPNKVGTTEIPPARIRGLIMDNNPNKFFAIPNSFNIQSKSLNINVLPVPGKNPQALLAKKLNVTDSWSVNLESITIGQPVTRTITIKATGVPYTLIPELKLETPKGVNSYPDKTLTDTSVVDDKLIGQKTFKIVYIPTSTGTIKFTNTKIKWWDINKTVEKTYILESKIYTVLNDGKKPVASSNVVATQKKPVKTTFKWWKYILIAIALCMITLIIAVVIKRRFKLTKRTTQQDYNLLKKAIHDKDIKALNHALIAFASSYTNKNIYTISDIKELINNQTLNELIDKLNLALYKGYQFDDFESLLEQINILSRRKKTKTTEFLKNLYPE